LILALLADIHSNLGALEACLAHARGRGADRIALLGDLVGYSAEAVEVVERAAALTREGAFAVKGNHDAAIDPDGGAGYMNESATAAIEWTRGVLSPAHKAFLAFVEEFEAGSADRPSLRVGIAHADSPARLTSLEELVRRVRPQAQIEVETLLGAVVGTHAGPGAVGFFWFQDS